MTTENTEKKEPQRKQFIITYSGIASTLCSLGMFLYIAFTWKDVTIVPMIIIAVLFGLANSLAIRSAVRKAVITLKQAESKLKKNNEELRARNIEVENMVRRSIKSNNQIAKQLLANEEYVVSIMDSYEDLIKKCKETGMSVEEHWNDELKKSFDHVREVCEETRLALKKVCE